MYICQYIYTHKSLFLCMTISTIKSSLKYAIFKFTRCSTHCYDALKLKLHPLLRYIYILMMDFQVTNQYTCSCHWYPSVNVHLSQFQDWSKGRFQLTGVSLYLLKPSKEQNVVLVGVWRVYNVMHVTCTKCDVWYKWKMIFV